jgi:DNA-binding CsgD family transcriptional regulator
LSGQDSTSERRRRTVAISVFTFTQACAAVFFASDAATDLLAAKVDLHTIVESVIAVGLLFGSLYGISELRRSHALLSSQEDALAAVNGALSEVIEAQFAAWGLTPAEREIGMLALKGLDTAEIAALRGAAQGTVRAQMASIYAKSGTSSRAQFAAFFVEDLLAGGVAAADTAARDAARAAAE